MAFNDIFYYFFLDISLRYIIVHIQQVVICLLTVLNIPIYFQFDSCMNQNHSNMLYFCYVSANYAVQHVSALFEVFMVAKSHWTGEGL